MVLAMTVLVALATLSGLTVVSVQGGITTSSNDRFHALAVYAAESGGAAAMDWLRANAGNGGSGWSAYVGPGSSAGETATAILGNSVTPGNTGNPFDRDVQSYYDIAIINNRSDPGYAAGNDLDNRVLIRATGHGPRGAIAIIEWDVQAGTQSTGRPCPSYGQKGMAEDGAGRNDCLGTINTAVSATFTPHPVGRP